MNGATPGMFSLEGRLALVTGGASGIGWGITTSLAAAGADVVIMDIDDEAAQARAAQLQGGGCRAHARHVDLADESSILAACSRTVDELGTPWVVVNCAGLQDRESFLEGTSVEWDRMNRVNARGPFLVTRQIARAMVAAGDGGRIVNIGSAVLRGSIVSGLVAYAGSKGALLGLSTAAAFELAAHGITVNMVLPGAVATPGAIAARGPAPQGPARRPLPLGMCEPEDIAGAVLYFASPAARRVTNQVIAVDGGFSVT